MSLGNFLYHGQCPSLVPALLLHLALSCAYIQTYPAVEAVSPSLAILLWIANAMPQGLTREQIVDKLERDRFLEHRIQDVVTAGFVRRLKSELKLTLLGYLFVLPFLFFRKILGLSVGEG